MPYNSGRSGRRKLTFEKSSGKNKRRKSKDLRKSIGLPELAHATNMNLLSVGKTDAAKLRSGALETAPMKALRIRKVWAAHTKNIFITYTSEEALSLFTEAQLTKSQYINILSQAKIKNCKMCPIFRVIKAPKVERYPSNDIILIQKYFVEMCLQTLMDETVSRIIMAKK
jgi:hypothetical protein